MNGPERGDSSTGNWSALCDEPMPAARRKDPFISGGGSHWISESLPQSAENLPFTGSGHYSISRGKMSFYHWETLTCHHPHDVFDPSGRPEHRRAF
ncbi:hypothetical protein [Sphingobium sp. CAP-1]|uniref:hypothetical protein n=1 Tax=Sphingobium sp. CAP-1 TaxID=2676077 RepID=UPI0012BB33AD|nr:hypothetical protein [Sphingobium sp. CAP-1]QGP78892.1 hypothetical protein GL174_07725 [Sphingobium sp. CAP-1]